MIRKGNRNVFSQFERLEVRNGHVGSPAHLQGLKGGIFPAHPPAWGGGAPGGPVSWGQNSRPCLPLRVSLYIFFSVSWKDTCHWI